ncbi:hypothetical protein [Microvirga arsenatis]|uniref:hypothetical protein n=1 Tax=Microvirga arsenatis TaxID=2692265 RepID=UPI00191C4804|nr:hypothetical protein [Microvirga arsenatis]
MNTEMRRTFVPDEALTQTRPTLANLYRERQSGLVSRDASRMRYDLFRNRHEPELCCAVPEHRPAPAFVRSEGWQLAGQIDATAPMPLGFDREAASIGAHLNGFYLFVAFSPLPALRSNAPDDAPLARARSRSPSERYAQHS